MKITVFAFYFFILSISSGFAREMVADFMVDEQGRVLQLKIISLGKKLVFNRNFPFDDSNRGLVLTDFETGKEYFKLHPKKAGLLWRAYALDSTRIVLNFDFHLGIWNIKTKAFRLYEKKGSFMSNYGYQISGVHPDENIIICSSTGYVNGLFFHELQKNTTTHIFKEYESISPRFSPDGSRYAFYGRERAHKPDEKAYLIIQLLNTQQTFKYEFAKGRFGVNLSWSPSGKYIAGIGPTGFTQHSLYLWKNSGELITIIPLTFYPKWDWAPLWLKNEKEIWIFYKINEHKKDEKILSHKFSLSGYGF